MKSEHSPVSPLVQEHFTTIEVARMLGLAVRSVQLMVDRNELEAWKTPGGHRRISRASVERWIHARSQPQATPESKARKPSRAGKTTNRAARVLLIEDSVHFQNLVSLLMQQQFPDVELHMAHDGITGMAMYGQTQPDVLLVDILLPGIDGAALITALRSNPQFAHSHLIVVTSLNEADREPYAFALQGIPVIHKPQLVAELGPALSKCLAAVNSSE